MSAPAARPVTALPGYLLVEIDDRVPIIPLIMALAKQGFTLESVNQNRLRVVPITDIPAIGVK